MRAKAAFATLVALALSGCSLLGLGGDSVEDLQVAVGECISDPALTTGEEGEVGALPKVECSEEHYAEVFYVEDLPEGDLPADASDIADEACWNNFEAFIGLPYEDSELYFFHTTPTIDSWNAGDRQIACFVVGDEGESFTASLEGANR